MGPPTKDTKGSEDNSLGMAVALPEDSSTSAPTSSDPDKHDDTHPGEETQNHGPRAASSLVYRVRSASEPCTEKPKKVDFASTLATDIISGDPISPHSMSGAEYRRRRAAARGADQKQLLSIRRRRLWLGPLRRVTTMWMAEDKARRIGGERRAVWQRILLQYMRQNGLNGMVDARSSRKHTRRS